MISIALGNHVIIIINYGQHIQIEKIDIDKYQPFKRFTSLQMSDVLYKL